jgi:hypothetical protein
VFDPNVPQENRDLDAGEVRAQLNDEDEFVVLRSGLRK